MMRTHSPISAEQNVINESWILKETGMQAGWLRSNASSLVLDRICQREKTLHY